MIANSQETLMHDNAMYDDERCNSKLLRTEVRVVLWEALLMVAHLSRWVTGKAAVATRWTWHAHRVDRWWWSRSVRSACRSRVVLRSAPTESDSRVPNRIPLHLIDGHLGSVSLNKLNKAAALARWDLDVCDLAKALEEGSQLIFSNIAGQTPNKDGGIIGVGELVHRLLTAVLATHRRIVHGARTAAAVSHVATMRPSVSTVTTSWHAHCHI